MKTTMKKLLAILLVGLPLAVAAQPTYIGTVHHGAASYYVSSRGSQVMASGTGNYILTGEYRDTVDFDPGPGTDVRIASDQEDVFVQRYDLQGNVLWTRTLDGVGREASPGHHVAADGSIYLSGCFYGSVDFDPGAGSAVYSFTGQPPYQDLGFGSSLYLLKLDSLGNFQWVQAFGDGTSFGGLRAVDTDLQGNVYTTGSVHMRTGSIALFDMDPSIGTDWFNHQGTSAIVQKLDAAGNYVWGKYFRGVPNGQPGSPMVESAALCIDHVGAIVTAGNFSGNIDFDPNAGNLMVSSHGEFDLYLHKLNANGQVAWVKSFGKNSPNLNEINKVTVDAQDNIYVMGFARDSLDMDPGAGVAYALGDSISCAFLAKYDPAGNLLYLKSWKGTAGFSLNDIHIGSTGEAYLVGSNIGTTDLDPGAGVLNFSALGFDVALLKLDAAGNFDWAVQVGDSSWDFGAGIALLGNQDLIASGQFAGTVDFDPGAGVDAYSALDHSHTFVTHYGVSPSTGVAPSTALDFALYPNPASSQVQLSWLHGRPNEVIWYDQNGAQVLRDQRFAAEGATFDVSGLPAGIYYVVIARGHERIARKVAVVH